jgi:TetR/AcrR family transcriptional regulator, cholesterol catabolism regulator
VTSVAERRAAILRTAAELFARQGFAETTVREIADACGMASGSIFHHYISKRELLVDVVAEGTVLTHGLVDAGLAQVEKPADRLTTLLACHLRALHGESKPFTVVAMNEFQRLTAEERERVVTKRDAYEQVWTRVLADAAEAGLVSPDPLLRLFLLGAANHTVLWYHPGADVSIDDLAARFVGLVTAGSSPDGDGRGGLAS